MKIFFKDLNKNALIKSSILIIVITFIAKIFGYGEKLVLAYYFGTSSEVDVYTTVVTFVLSIFVLFREIIEPGFLNGFLQLTQTNDEASAWSFFNYIFRIILVFTILLSITVFLFPKDIVIFLAPGFSPSKAELAASLLQIAFPATIFLALSALTNITLNGLKLFAFPSLGDLLFKVGILISLIISAKFMGIYATGLGIVVGGALKLGLHLIKLHSKISFECLDVNKSSLSQAWQQTWPLLIGVSFSQISSIVDNIFASYLQEGVISAINYSKKIIELPIITFPYVISVVIFPYLAELKISNQKEKSDKLLSNTISLILVTFIPLTIFFLTFSYQIVEVVYQRGAFGTSSTILTYRPFLIYSLGMIFMALETIVVIYYFANQDTKSPIFIGIICVGVNLLAAFVGIKLIGYLGIPLAQCISKVLKVLILFGHLKAKKVFKLRMSKSLIKQLLIGNGGFALIVISFKMIFVDYLSLSSLTKFAGMTSIFILASFVYYLILNTKELRSEFKVS